MFLPNDKCQNWYLVHAYVDFNDNNDDDDDDDDDILTIIIKITSCVVDTVYPDRGDIC